MKRKEKKMRENEKKKAREKKGVKKKRKKTSRRRRKKTNAYVLSRKTYNTQKKDTLDDIEVKKS